MKRDERMNLEAATAIAARIPSTHVTIRWRSRLLELELCYFAIASAFSLGSLSVSRSVFLSLRVSLGCHLRRYHLSRSASRSFYSCICSRVSGSL